MPKISFIADAAAHYCHKLTTRSKSNFYYAFLFLPQNQREALEAVYSYCRLVDDVVDEEAPPGSEATVLIAKKLEGIAHWRSQLDAVYGDAPSEHPVVLKLRQAVRAYPIRREDMEAVIDGCAMDITQSRYATWDELRTYCYRVASAVGLMCIEIFGYTTPKAREYAVDLGIALQLTNILRDVAEDAKRGRIYLPKEDLDAFGVTEADLVGGRLTPAFVRMMRHEAQRARSHYLRARAAIGRAERRQLVVAEIMGDIYHALLERLEKSEFDVFSTKATVTRGRKMAIAIGKFAQAKLGG
jgi:phytoene synthase